MGAENVCRHFKLGFCKFKNKCKSKHVNEVCEEISCEVQSCDLRHPRTCKFYSAYGRCKFGEWCFYKHEKKTNRLLDSDYQELMNKLNQLEKKMNEKDIIIGELVNKMESFGLKTEIENLEKMIHEKDIKITVLEENIDSLKDVIESKREIDNNEAVIYSNDQAEYGQEVTFYNPSASLEPCEYSKSESTKETEIGISVKDSQSLNKW